MTMTSFTRPDDGKSGGGKHEDKAGKNGGGVYDPSKVKDPRDDKGKHGQ